MALTGLDVSRYQTTTPPLANYSFMFARATFGIRMDIMFATHIAAAKKAGIVTGAYHFGYGSEVASPEAQAQAFMRRALRYGADIWALDYEPSDAPMTKAEARRFIAEVHKAGYRIGLYASRSGFPFDLGQDFDWIADWDANVFPAHAEFWQYRGSPLDLDKFNGTLAALRLLAARPIPLPDTSTEVTDQVNYINSNGAFDDNGRALFRVHVLTTDTWVALDKSETGHFKEDADVVYIGLADGVSDAVLITTPALFSDGVARLTPVMLAGPHRELLPNKAPEDTTPYDEADVETQVAARIADAIKADRAKATVSIEVKYPE